MKKDIGLKSALGVVGFMLIGATYFAAQKRKRDRMAKEILGKLTTLLNPTTKGLIREAALDTSYVDTVLNTIPSKVVVLQKSTAIRYANEIHNAFKPWYLGGDIEEKVYAVFRSLKDKVQVSQVAKAYQNEHGLDLKDQLKDRFDTNEIKIVLGIVSRLPKYRIL